MSEHTSRAPDPDAEPRTGGATDTSAIAREVEELERRSSTAARLFDIRRILGGLFVVYGVIVTIAGIFASEEDLEKAEDVNINLWTGLAMLILGVFFLVWLRLSPTLPPPDEDPAAADGDPDQQGAAGAAPEADGTEGEAAQGAASSQGATEQADGPESDRQETGGPEADGQEKEPVLEKEPEPSSPSGTTGTPTVDDGTPAQRPEAEPSEEERPEGGKA